MQGLADPFKKKKSQQFVLMTHSLMSHFIILLHAEGSPQLRAWSIQS